MTHTQDLPQRVLSGSWNANISWEFYLSDTLPDADPCTAVYCLAIADAKDLSVVLTRNHRGWEMLGGHIEPDESIQQALFREAMEEGGFSPTWHTLFGYSKLQARKPVANSHHGGFYPQVSYVAHFLATTTDTLIPPSGEEIIEAKVFDVRTLPELSSYQALIMKAGLTEYGSKHLD